MAEKYDFDNVPFSKPNRTDYLYQVDFKNANIKGDPETNIHKFGCCFMSHLTIVQTMHNQPLKYNEVLAIYNMAMQSDWLGESCWVKNPHAIMAYAERMLTRDKPKFTYEPIKCIGVTMPDRTFGQKYMSANRLPSKSNIYFCVVDFNTKSGPAYGGHHFVLFSGTGNLLYDPNKADLSSGYVSVCKVVFWRVDNYVKS